MKTILVTGANGQLGSEIKLQANLNKHFKFIFTDVKTLDITNREEVEAFFSDKKIDFIVNCAAYTAVDKAEEDEKMAFKINALAVENLAKTAQKYHSKLVHISTDYVFDGYSYVPYKETDTVNPQSVYGKSKLAGEQHLTDSGIDYIILRTSWLYSSIGNNFVKTILKFARERDELKVVFDQTGTPTYAADLAQAILQILQEKFVSGIYHFANEGVCSWYDFAVEIKELANISCQITPVETKEFPRPAHRPPYSVLNKEKFRTTFNYRIPYWRDSLKVCYDLLK